MLALTNLLERSGQEIDRVATYLQGLVKLILWKSRPRDQSGFSVYILGHLQDCGRAFGCVACILAEHFEQFTAQPKGIAG